MAKGSKDYGQYFDFTDAKIISETEGKTTYRIKGRNVQINSQPHDCRSQVKASAGAGGTGSSCTAMRQESPRIVE